VEAPDVSPRNKPGSVGISPSSVNPASELLQRALYV
jgi:hypothetical protein